MTSRLDTVAPGVVELLASAKPATLRRIASRLAEIAVARTGLTDPAIHDGLEALRIGMFGDSTARTAVKQLVETLDEQYWKLQDSANAGYATESDHLTVFSRARAASALDFFLDVDPYVAATEGAYEVLIAVDDLEAVSRLIATEIAR